LWLRLGEQFGSGCPAALGHCTLGTAQLENETCKGHPPKVSWQTTAEHPFHGKRLIRKALVLPPGVSLNADERHD